MFDEDLMKTEVVYRSVIENLISEIKAELKNEKDKKALKELKRVKFFNYILCLQLNSFGYLKW